MYLEWGNTCALHCRALWLRHHNQTQLRCLCIAVWPLSWSCHPGLYHGSSLYGKLSLMLFSESMHCPSPDKAQKFHWWSQLSQSTRVTGKRKRCRWAENNESFSFSVSLFRSSFDNSRVVSHKLLSHGASQEGSKSCIYSEILFLSSLV